MNKLITIVLATAFLAFQAPAPALAADGAPQVAVVNIVLIMRDSSAAQSVREQLEKKQKAFQAEVAKKEEALQKEDQELGKQRSVLSKEAFEEKVRAFRNKATDAQKEIQSKKAMYDAAFERALGEIQKVVTEIIGGLAKEKGFTVALPMSQVLYADGSLDISDPVLKQLNQKLPRLDVKFDAPKQ